LARIGGESEVDLAQHGREIVPELLRVHTPDDFELQLLDGSWLRAQDGHVAVELTGQLVPLDGDSSSTGVVQRRLDTLARRAEHHKLELPAWAQGEGRGRAMVRRSVDLYTDLGIERVSLLAVDTGRYVWAASGFSFADERARRDVVEGVEDAAELLGLDLADLDHDECDPWDIAFLPPIMNMSLRDALEVLAPDELEDLELHADALDAPPPRPGKLLLLAEAVPGWRGVLDLRAFDGNRGLETFYDYTD
jgi:hypothetical protein